MPRFVTTELQKTTRFPNAVQVFRMRQPANHLPIIMPNLYPTKDADVRECIRDRILLCSPIRPRHRSHSVHRRFPCADYSDLAKLGLLGTHSRAVIVTDKRYDPAICASSQYSCQFELE